MDDPELIERTRASIGEGALAIMDVVTPEIMDALGELARSAERVAGLLQEHGAREEQVMAILAGGAYAVVADMRERDD